MFLNLGLTSREWFQFCTGEFAMKLSKQVLPLLLCFSLLRFTAQAESFAPTGESSEQKQPPPVPQGTQERHEPGQPVAVQAKRQQARNAGHLDSNEQEKVTTQANTIVIEPANPEVVYVPAYDPWLVYGDSIVPYPGWYPVPGIFFAGPAISFGIGFGVGYF